MGLDVRPRFGQRGGRSPPRVSPMKRRQFLNTSLLAAAVSLPGIRTAYAVVGSDTVADLPAITGDGRQVLLRGADIRDLAAKMRGSLLLANDKGYDRARLV